MASEFQPYVGPRPFEREDWQRFFGRERESSELLSRVVAHPAVLIYSPSGAGKTSLLNASLVPLLEKEGFEVLPTARVRGLAPEDIAAEDISNLYVFNVLLSWVGGSVEPSSVGGSVEPEALTKLRLLDFLNSRPRRTGKNGEILPRVAVFDQFEELFTFYPERWSDREDFFDQVSEAVEADRTMRVIFVMREDYIAELDPYVFVLPEKLRTRFRLERLREDSALEAVKAPLADTGYSFAEGNNGQPGVAEQLVSNLLRVPVETAAGVATVIGEFVEPVQLQVVCQNLWQKLDPSKDNVITQEQLQAFGDVDQALSEFYENAIATVVNDFRANEGQLRRWFEHTLITPSGTRGTVYRGRDETGLIPNVIVDKLVDQHVIRAEVRGGARWYELTHDRLIKPIIDSNNRWMLQRSSAEQTRQLLETKAAGWVRGGRPKSGLLDEAELLEATRWLESPSASDVGYSDALIALVQASRAQVEEAAHERERQLFVEQQRRAEAEHARAEEQQQRMKEQAEATSRLFIEQQGRAEAEHARAEEQKRRLKEQTKAVRRFRLLAAALALMFLLSIAAAGFAVNQSRLATKQTRLAQEKAQDADDALKKANVEAIKAQQQSAIATEAQALAEREAQKARELEAVARESAEKAEANAKAATETARAKESEVIAVTELARYKESEARREAARERAEELTNDAEDAENSDALDKAIEKYNAAIDKYRELNDEGAIAGVLLRAAYVYRRQNNFTAAEKSYQSALQIRREQFGSESNEVATILNYLGVTSAEKKDYEHAGSFYKQALAIRRKIDAPIDDLVLSLRNLGNLYRSLRTNQTYLQAAEIYREALNLLETKPGSRDIEVARGLRDLAGVYVTLGRQTEAEPLLKRALAIYESKASSGQSKVDLANSLLSLASIYTDIGQFTTAEGFVKRAGEIQKEGLYGEKPDRAFNLTDLAGTQNLLGLIYQYTGRYEAAESAFNSALEINKTAQGPNSTSVGVNLHNLALTHFLNGQYAQVEELEESSLEIARKTKPVDPASIASSLTVLARLYSARGDYSKSESFFKQALDEDHKVFADNHPRVAVILNYQAQSYAAQGKYEVAEQLALKCKTNLEQAWGSTWRFATALNTLATIYVGLKRFDQAEALYKQALTTLENTFGEYHPEIAISLNGLGKTYLEKDRPDYGEALTMLKRALDIQERMLGPEHPSLANTLDNYAACLRATNRATEAEKIVTRAKAIRAKFPQLAPEK